LRVVTKFAHTGSLEALPHAKRTRVRYSINTPHVAHNFEAGTDPVPERINAANRMGLAGYPIGFIIAPLMIYDGWREEYAELLGDLAGRLDARLHDGLTFELITHRFTGKAKKIIHDRFPRCGLDLDESRRQVKRGQYGHKKYVYPAGEWSLLQRQLEESVVQHFPSATIEYTV
jgi:spore photoproduct lyase